MSDQGGDDSAANSSVGTAPPPAETIEEGDTAASSAAPGSEPEANEAPEAPSPGPAADNDAAPSGVESGAASSAVTLDVPTAALTADNLASSASMASGSTSTGDRSSGAPRSVSGLSVVSRGSDNSRRGGGAGSSHAGGSVSGRSGRQRRAGGNNAGGLRRNMLDPGNAGAGGARSRTGSRAGSTRSHRRRHGDNASAADRSIASDQDLTNVDVPAVEAPPGVAPLWLSQSTQSLFRAVTDEHVTRDFPLKIVGRDEVLEDLATRGVVSDFDKVAAGVRASDQEDFLIVYDVDRIYGENFYICLTAEARRSELDRISKLEVEGAGASTGDDDHEVGVVTVSSTPYESRGSEQEVDDYLVTDTRPKLALAITRRRREFGAPVRFGDRDAHDGLSESRSFKDPNYELRRIELDRGCQAVPEKATVSAQTTWNRPVNMAVQYEAIDVDEDARAQISESEDLAAFLRNAWPVFEHALQQNETVNVTLDDFALLAREDAGIGTQSDSLMKELTSFADLFYCKDRYVSCIDWQPRRKGILAVSVCENLGFEDRVGASGRVSTSYLLVWNFVDPIQPQLVLEAPSDVLVFRFNPHEPNIVAGGCINGQVVVWDIGAAQRELRQAGRAATPGARSGGKASAAAAKAARAAEAASPDGAASSQGAADDSQGRRGVGGSKDVPVIPYLFVSSIEHSHRRAVTDLQWLSGARHVGMQGKTSVNPQGATTNFATTAADGQVLFWDVSRPRRDPKKFDLAWAPNHRVPLNRTDGTASDIGGVALNIGRPDKGSRFFVVSEEGDLVYADWSPSLDDKPKHVAGLYRGHYGNCRSVERSPFMDDVILTAGDWTFSLWKEGVDQPVFTSPPSPTYITCARWSPTRPGLIFCGKIDGKVDIWDLTDRSHEPSITQSITSAAVETIEFWPFPPEPAVDPSGLNANTNPVAGGASAAGGRNRDGAAGSGAGRAGKGAGGAGGRRGGAAGKKNRSGGNLIAIGDTHGTAHVLRIPRSLMRPAPHEAHIIESFFDWEARRVDYMRVRRKVRADELQAMERDAALRLDREEGEDEDDFDDPDYGYGDEDAARSDADGVDPIEAERAEEAYRAMEANFKAELGIVEEEPALEAEPDMGQLESTDEDDDLASLRSGSAGSEGAAER